MKRQARVMAKQYDRLADGRPLYLQGSRSPEFLFQVFFFKHRSVSYGFWLKSLT